MTPLPRACSQLRAEAIRVIALPDAGVLTVATYCYDTADRLVGTSQAGYGAGIVYDDHGNTTALAGETLGYDGADRHVTTTAGAVTVTYVRDVTDRIVSRTVPAAAPRRAAIWLMSQPLSAL